MSDEELFTRFLYIGMVHLHMTEEETWLTPMGLLLDLWECHRQFLGLSKPRVQLSIDDIIPVGI